MLLLGAVAECRSAATAWRKLRCRSAAQTMSARLLSPPSPAFSSLQVQVACMHNFPTTYIQAPYVPLITAADHSSSKPQKQQQQQTSVPAKNQLSHHHSPEWPLHPPTRIQLEATTSEDCAESHLLFGGSLDAACTRRGESSSSRTSTTLRARALG